MKIRPADLRVVSCKHKKKIGLSKWPAGHFTTPKSENRTSNNQYLTKHKSHIHLFMWHTLITKQTVPTTY